MSATGFAGAAFLGLGGQAHAADDTDRFRGLTTPVKATQPITIGATVVHLNDDYWKGVAYGIADEAKLAGAKISRMGVAGGYGNVTQQFAQLSTMRALGTNVYIIGAAAFDGFDPVLAQLQASGGIVVAAGNLLNSKHVDLIVGQDDISLGETLGQAVVADAAGKKVTVITIPGPAGAEWVTMRHQGFLQGVKTAPNVTVVEGPVGGAIDVSYAESQASDLLLKNPDAVYVYTPETTLGMGAVLAAERLKRKVKVVTSTVVPAALPLVSSGEILALVSEPGVLIGRLCVQYAIRKKQGMDLPNLTPRPDTSYPQLVIPNKVLTAANVSSYSPAEYDLPPPGWSMNAFE